jgi:hypothetical protein
MKFDSQEGPLCAVYDFNLKRIDQIGRRLPIWYGTDAEAKSVQQAGLASENHGTPCIRT